MTVTQVLTIANPAIYYWAIRLSPDTSQGTCWVHCKPLTLSYPATAYTVNHWNRLEPAMSNPAISQVPLFVIAVDQADP